MNLENSIYVFLYPIRRYDSLIEEQYFPYIPFYKMRIFNNAFKLHYSLMRDTH